MSDSATSSSSSSSSSSSTWAEKAASLSSSSSSVYPSAPSAATSKELGKSFANMICKSLEDNLNAIFSQLTKPLSLDLSYGYEFLHAYDWQWDAAEKNFAYYEMDEDGNHTNFEKDGSPVYYTIDIAW